VKKTAQQAADTSREIATLIQQDRRESFLLGVLLEIVSASSYRYYSET